MFASNQNPIPNGFSLLGVDSTAPTGIRVNATSNFNNATVQCIVFGVVGPMQRNDSTLAIATLRVAGTQY